MICVPCQEGSHCMSDKCTCQHRHKAQVVGVEGVDTREEMGEIGG